MSRYSLGSIEGSKYLLAAVIWPFQSYERTGFADCGFFVPVHFLPPGATILLCFIKFELVTFFFFALALLERDLFFVRSIVIGSGCSVEKIFLDLSKPVAKLSYSLV